MKKMAGFLSVLTLLGLSLIPSVNYIGDTLERVLIFALMLSTLISISALLSVYRDVKLFNMAELKVIAVSYPLLTILDTIYPLIKYSDQTLSSGLLNMQLLLIGYALVVSFIIIRKSKECH
ncbi:hypothetical protein [uncultured Photobacterium sp.]|uniref:hypothetical protein n=1 Tax=uncultured Photobacterium sp. TaxID=173973 RepID=UPI00261F1A4C|nr:hypothetical protein [uncultured Photobacterium sp.]